MDANPNIADVQPLSAAAKRSLAFNGVFRLCAGAAVLVIALSIALNEEGAVGYALAATAAVLGLMLAGSGWMMLSFIEAGRGQHPAWSILRWFPPRRSPEAEAGDREMMAAALSWRHNLVVACGAAASIGNLLLVPAHPVAAMATGMLMGMLVAIRALRIPRRQGTYLVLSGLAAVAVAQYFDVIWMLVQALQP